ncbi:MAG: DUF3109 family protein [Prevotella sp.]|nr:DUF3109 family protein [Prevotella sp.]
MDRIPPILDIDGVLISSDLLTEEFCCDLEVCKGACCIEGDAGAPVTLDEIGEIENILDEVWEDLSASAQAVIDRQGVAYTDQEGDLVTSIVNGKNCVFTCYDNLTLPDGKTAPHCCLCALEKAHRSKSNLSPLTPHLSPLTPHLSPLTSHPFIKPISCALYPIREKTFSDGTVALNYHRWDICQCGREKGKALHLPVYQFLKQPLVRRFGEAWYQELCDAAEELLHR